MLEIFARPIFVALAILNLAADAVEHQKCPRFQIKRNTMINAKASLNEGAKYLGKFTANRSRACYYSCCENKDCNFVLLKLGNGEMNCYMFDCGSPSKCVHNTLPSYKRYVSLELDRRGSWEGSQNTYSSQDNSADVHRPQTTVTEKVQVPTTQARHYKFHKKYNWQSGFKKTTEKHKQWYDKTTISAPYHTFHHSKSNEDRQLDRISHNYSGKKNTFDEEAKTHEFHEPTKLFDNKWQSENKKGESYQGYDGSENTFDRGHDVSDVKKVVTHKKPTEAGDNESKSEEEDFPRRVFVDNNPDYPEAPHGHTKSTRSTREPTKVSTKEPKSTKNSEQTRKPESTEKPESDVGYHNVVIKRVNIQENKAIIPLAVGLVLALLLLMGVVFRLRTSRRRRTKAFLTDDADYLINGMYL